MGKLEQLKQLVADMFDKCERKDDIDKLSTIKNTIDEVEGEQQELIDKNSELIKSYKDLVKHTSFKNDNNIVEKNNEIFTPTSISFEETLSNFINNNMKENN